MRCVDERKTDAQAKWKGKSTRSRHVVYERERARLATRQVELVDEMNKSNRRAVWYTCTTHAVLQRCRWGDKVMEKSVGPGSRKEKDREERTGGKSDTRWGAPTRSARVRMCVRVCVCVRR